MIGDPHWVNAALQSTDASRECVAFLRTILLEEIHRPQPDIARLSIALGAVETSLISSEKSTGKALWPTDIAATTANLTAAFQNFVEQLHQQLQQQPGANPREKVILVANAVWAKLTGSFSKDVLHFQHVYHFCRYLGPEKSSKRQLDCAGVTTTTLAACQRLAAVHGHTDLQRCTMQISEDHCWLTFGSGSRGDSIEVTTNTAAKRGLWVGEECWNGWIYTGGEGAVLCNPAQTLAALITSLDPAVSAKQDCAALQALQYSLLRMLCQQQPDASYPAALCTLGDLEEIALQDQLDAALAAGDAGTLQSFAHRPPPESFYHALTWAPGKGSTTAHGNRGAVLAPGTSCKAQGGTQIEDAALRTSGVAAAEGAVSAATGTAEAALEAPVDARGHGPASQAALQQAEGAGTGRPLDSCAWALQQYHWYPYSFMAGFWGRRAGFLGKCAAAFPAHAAMYSNKAKAALLEAVRCAGLGGRVLARYSYETTDDQLVKDVSGALESLQEGIAALAKHEGGEPLQDPALLSPLLELWDGVCCWFAGRPKPSAWVALVVKTLKCFSPRARALAVEAAAPPASMPMQKAAPLWVGLKVATIKPLFEVADVQGEAREPKRRRL